MNRISRKKLSERAGKIKLVLMDVDGVLTGGHLYHFVDSAGRLVEFKGIHAQDSIALAWLAQSGLKTGLISGRVSEGLEVRAKELNVAFVYQHRIDKKDVFEEICETSGCGAQECAFIGDDLPDIPVIRAAGLGVAVRNARPEVKAAAAWVTTAAGGQGALREVAELILRAQGKWQAILQRFEGADK